MPLKVIGKYMSTKQEINFFKVGRGDIKFKKNRSEKRLKYHIMTSDLCNLPERLNQERKFSGRNFLENLEQFS